MAASMIIFAIMLGLVVYGFGHKIDAPAEGRSIYNRLAHAGQDGRGANLDAPADPSQPYPARPEWYFLSLFQLLKYFEGENRIIGTVVIPNGVFVLLFLLPLFGYGRSRPLGHVLGVVVVVGVVAAAASLTCLALADDTSDPANSHLLAQLGLVAVPIAAGVLLVLVALLALL